MKIQGKAFLFMGIAGIWKLSLCKTLSVDELMIIASTKDYYTEL